MSEETKHTPGPWKGTYLFKNGKKRTITIRDLGGYTIAELPRDRPQSEQEANSNLLEAAPEMIDRHNMNLGMAREAIRFLDKHLHTIHTEGPGKERLLGHTSELTAVKSLLESITTTTRAAIAAADGEEGPQ